MNHLKKSVSLLLVCAIQSSIAGEPIYVSVGPDADDTNIGTQGEPMATLGAALALQSSSGTLRPIYMTEGEFIEDFTHVLTQSTQIFGGFDTLTWERLLGTGHETSIFTDEEICFELEEFGDPTRTLVLDRVSVETAGGVDGDLANLSSVGILIGNGWQEILISNSLVRGGNGGVGTSGASGAGGASGGTGVRGQSACADGFPCGSCSRPNGGNGGGGAPGAGAGGRGGNAGFENQGGAPGFAGGFSNDGSAGGTGGAGTPDGLGNNCGVAFSQGGNGQGGANGSHGDGGLVYFGFVSSGLPQDGEDGFNGAGGGGGRG
ncbi:hypothetical protein COB72_07810, partial [bacterium]